MLSKHLEGTGILGDNLFPFGGAWVASTVFVAIVCANSSLKGRGLPGSNPIYISYFFLTLNSLLIIPFSGPDPFLLPYSSSLPE